MALSSLYGGGMSSRLFQQVREKRGYAILSFHLQLAFRWWDICRLRWHVGKSG